MIVIKSNQSSCDHVFSFTSQDGGHIFKCENCPAEFHIAEEDKATVDLPL